MGRDWARNLQQWYTALVTLQREYVLDGVRAELVEFCELITALSTTELRQPSRCTDWTVAHVAGHVIGTAVDVSQGRFEGQGTAAVNQRQARERLGRSPQLLAEELVTANTQLVDLLASIPPEQWQHPAPNDPAFSTGFAIEAIWYDAFLHADDIRAALGIESARGDGLICAVEHIAGYLTQQGRSLTLDLDGLEPINVGDGGPRVTADPLRFVLVATGRDDPATLGLGPWVNVYGDLAE